MTVETGADAEDEDDERNETNATINNDDDEDAEEGEMEEEEDGVKLKGAVGKEEKIVTRAVDYMETMKRELAAKHRQIKIVQKVSVRPLVRPSCLS